ncbi:MAG: tetratricopeptide repeat protein, partial [Promethearchaeota archaeon]
MLQQLPEELACVGELIDQAKLEEALEIIEEFENIESLSPEDQLSALLIKARIYAYTHQFQKNIDTSELAYQLSQKLGLTHETIQALIGKAYVVFLGDLDNASKYISDAERKLKSLKGDHSIERFQRDLLYIKSWILLFKGELNRAGELAQESLRLTEEKNLVNKLSLASNYLVLGWIYGVPAPYQPLDYPKALEYAMESLKLNAELNHSVAIADDYSLIAHLYWREGDYNQAIQYCKQSLSIKENTNANRLTALRILSDIYFVKYELNRALKYRKQALALAEELNNQ